MSKQLDKYLKMEEKIIKDPKKFSPGVREVYKRHEKREHASPKSKALMKKCK
jgi:hypothetical protein